MDQGPAITLLMLVSLVLANAPFLSPRVMLIGPLRPQRAIGWRLLELLALGILCLLAGWAYEGRIGQRHPQNWQFYVTVLSLLVTFAFPGFAWRYLRRQHAG